MGLDVYVGSLTRYYAGDWETIVQQTAREQGFSAEIVRASEPPEDAITDPDTIRELVEAWQRLLELDWNESPEAPYRRPMRLDY